MVQVVYPYNPLGVNPECFIEKERGFIPSLDNTYRVVIPELAPFFEEGLVVYHPQSKRNLTLGTDFILGHKVTDVASIAAKPLYGSIVIINKDLFGHVETTYNTIGSDFIPLRSDVLTYLANVLTDPVKTPWEKVDDRPEFFWPYRHHHDWHDFVNTDDIAAAIDRLTEQVQVSTDSKEEIVVALLTQVAELNELLDTVNHRAHRLSRENPHGLDGESVDALPVDGDAVDTNKAYGLELPELGRYVKDRGIVDSHVDKLVHSHGSTMTSAIQIQKGIFGFNTDVKMEVVSDSDSSIVITSGSGMSVRTR